MDLKASGTNLKPCMLSTRRCARTVGALTFAWLGAIALFVAAAQTQAQVKFPTKPVRLIVPATPGNPSDVLARIIGPKLSEVWGNPVVLENRPGAGGTVAAAFVSKATPDGYTMLVAVGAFVTSAAFQTNLSYDPIKDFAGVAQIGHGTSVLVVAPSIGVKSVKEFIEFAKANPGKIFFGSAGAGGGSHFIAEKFKHAAGIKAVHVGYKGQPEALIEVVAGRSHYAMITLPAVMPLLKDGRLTALGVTSPQRSPQLPEVPALAEYLPEFTRPDTTQALLAPAKTPRAVLDQISKDVRRVLVAPDLVKQFHTIGYTVMPSTPEEQDKIRRSQIEAMTKLAIDIGLRAK
jgi:tripartite-type tricarboxylate transporter receptor subunit TctC